MTYEKHKKEEKKENEKDDDRDYVEEWMRMNSDICGLI